MDNKANDISTFTANTGNAAATGASSFIDQIRGISLTTWVIVIFVFAFLGVNVFVYLAKGTQDISDFLKPVTDLFTKLFGNVSAQVVDVTAEGAKAVVGTAAGTLNAGLSGVQKITPGGMDVKETIPQPDIMKSNTLNRALNSAKQKSGDDDDNGQYAADDTGSNIRKGAGKSGWCLVGSDHGVRSCVQVGANDDCLSGDIFSSKDICVNPRLRA
jgi:hypothetical protein